MALTEPAFEELFTTHYETLYRYAFSIIRAEAFAAEIVSDVFCKLWQKKDTLPVDPSGAGYLYTAVHHAAMDHLKHHKVKKRYENHLAYHNRQDPPANEATHRAELSDFQRGLQQALEKLPDQCRLIFHLSRVEELSYKEIAARLGLSVRTVEVQISRALKRLRISLAHFLTVMIVVYGILA